VVTASAEVAAFARTLGAVPILQPAETGTASAFALALRELEPLHLDSVLMIAGDLPLITSTALERLIAARDADNAFATPRYSPQVAGAEKEWGHPIRKHAPAPTLAQRPEDEATCSAIIVPDRHRIGTNALLCTPPSALAPCFGGDSFRRHLAAANNAGIGARVIEIPELALDLDCAADLDELRLRDRTTAEALYEGLRDIDVKREAIAQRVAGVSR
jgi:2-phospho-L-lactate guanylyltransferase